MRINPIKQHIAATLHDLRKLEADGHLEHAPRYIMSVLEDLHDLQDASEAFYRVMENSQDNHGVVEKLDAMIAESLKPVERHSRMLSIECHAVMLRVAADAVRQNESLDAIKQMIREVQDQRLALLESGGLHTDADEAEWSKTVAHAKGLSAHTIH